MQTIRAILTLISLAGLALSCNQSTDESPSSTADSGQASTDSGTDSSDLKPYQQIPVANCGMSPYTLIDPAELGEVVDSVELPGMDISKETIDAYLQFGGINWEGVYGANVFQFRYTTQDRGQRVEATALLAYPTGEDLPDPLPLAIFPAATLGFSDACTSSSRFELQVAAAAFASQGFVAVFPDYIGLTGMGEPSTQIHPYLIAEPAAIASWDALVAGEKLFASLETGNNTSKKTILTGASQGAQTALFAERFGYYYTPQYDVVGIIAFAAPTDFIAQAHHAVNEWTNNSFYHIAMLTAMNQWYGLGFDMSNILTNTEPHYLADNVLELFYSPDSCAPDEEIFDLLNATESTFNPEWVNTILTSGIDSIDTWKCPIEQASLHKTSVPANRVVPTLMVYGEEDPVVPPNNMFPSYQALCAEGLELEYSMCQGASHTDTIYWSLAEAIDWAQARIDGTPSSSEICTQRAPHCCSGSDPQVCTP